MAVIDPALTRWTPPAGAERVLIDLRDLGHGADRLAAGLAFGTDQDLGQRTLRQFMGFPSQDVAGPTRSSETAVNLTLTARGEADLPLTFLTGQHLSPEAATIVASLRQQEKADLMGYDVFSAVAESTWSGVEDAGLMWRSSEISVGGQRLADVIASDAEVSTIDEALAAMDTVSMGTLSETAERTSFGPYIRDRGMPDSTLGDGERRAALLVAYGTLDWFYPYFQHVGRGIDDALLAEWLVLDTVADGDRKRMMQSLGRLMHSIHDGHGFYSDWASTDWPDGYLGVQIQNVDGEPVIRESVHPDIDAGDTIVEIEGQSASDWYAEAMTRYSASSDGYRFVQATYELKEVYGSKALTFVTPTASSGRCKPGRKAGPRPKTCPGAVFCAKTVGWMTWVHPMSTT